MGIKKLGTKIMLLAIVICLISSVFFIITNVIMLNRLRTQTEDLYYEKLYGEFNDNIKSAADIASYSLKTFYNKFLSIINFYLKSLAWRMPKKMPLQI
jgi:hypothetical protein